MRIAVLGAGAIGSAVGALLARTGQEVTLVARPEHVAAIRLAGLRVDGPRDSFTIPLKAEPALDFRPDLALLSMKTQDVRDAVRASRGFLEDIPVVTMQNGIQSDSIVAEVLRPNSLLSTVVQLAATYLSPGRVTIVDRGHLVLGRPHGPRDALVEQVASVLRPAVPTAVSDNLVGAHWLKLILNLNNAIPAVTNLTIGEFARDPFLRLLAVRLMREGLRVADARQVALEPLGGVSVRTVRLVTRLPLPLASRFFGSRAGDLGSGWPVLGSTLQSLRRGRPSEIEYLNGEIVRLGGPLGVRTPANARIVELVHEVERTGQFYSAGKLRGAFAGIVAS